MNPDILTMTDEEFLAMRRARRAARAEAAKPKLEVAVSPKIVEAVKANPTSLRISARAADGTTVIDRPRQTEVIEVLEVDAEGRPALARRFDVATNAWGLCEYREGYRQPAGAVSDYSPLSALERGR